MLSFLSFSRLEIEDMFAYTQIFTYNNENYFYMKDSWILDVYNESLQDSNDSIEDNDSDVDNSDDNYNDESISNEQNDSTNREMSFERLREMLKNDDAHDTIEAEICVSKSEVLFAVLKYGLTHNLSQTAIADLFKMINCIFGFMILPESRYLIDQIFSSKSNV